MRDPITGTVCRVNGTGFQIHERPGTWLNISQYATPRPELPEVGQTVTLGLDSKGYVRTIEATDTLMPAPDVPSARPPAGPAPISRIGISLTVRLASLQAAATFLAGREDVKSPDLLGVAERVEDWVNRPASQRTTAS
jgi:hypothetical protein